MKFWLYEMKGDKRYLNKQPFMTALYNEGEQNDYFEGSIIDDTSVIDPFFKFSREKYWKRCNYIFCQDMNRSYYVQDVTLSRGYVLVKCHVDVLMTFRDSIANQKVILKRASKWDYNRNSAYNYNKYLNDDKFKAYSAEMNRCLSFPNNRTANVFSEHTTKFVMCVVGNTNNNEEPEGGNK